MPVLLSGAWGKGRGAEGHGYKRLCSTSALARQALMRVGRGCDNREAGGEGRTQGPPTQVKKCKKGRQRKEEKKKSQVS